MIEDLRIQTEKGYNYAVYLLSLKLRTEGEIREKLRIKKYELGITEKIISHLKENKYIDDQRYAEIYLENLKKYKNFGFYGIKKKLMEKRLPAEIIEKVLQEDLSLEEELKIAKRLLKKQPSSGVILSPSASEDEESLKYIKRSFADAQSLPRVLRGDDAEIAKQKLAQKLKARGFRGEVVAKLVF